MTEPRPTVNFHPLAIRCTLWVVARIAPVAQDHGSMIACVPTPHAWAVVRLAVCERLALGGSGTNRGNACSCAWPEQVTYLCYRAQTAFHSLGGKAPINRVINQLAEVLNHLMLFFL